MINEYWVTRDGRESGPLAIAKNEQTVAELESAIAALEDIMSTPEGSTQHNFEKYAALKKQLTEAENEWEQNMEQLENLNQ